MTKNGNRRIRRIVKATRADLDRSIREIASEIIPLFMRPVRFFNISCCAVRYISAFIIISPTEGDGRSCFRRRRYVGTYIGI